MRELPRRSGNAGFTIVEAISVIVILGIIALTANASFRRSDLEGPATRNYMRAVLDHMQKSAIASRRIAQITIDTTAGTITAKLCKNAMRTSADCDTAVAGNWIDLGLPGTGSNIYTLPSGYTLTTSLGAGVQRFTFDALGRPGTNAALPVPLSAPVTISATTGATTYTIEVSVESGYIHE